MFDAQSARRFVWEAPGHQAPHSITYPPHSFFDMLFLRVGKAQAKLLLTTAVYVEWLANDECNLLMSCLTQQRTRTHIAQQATPDMEASLWVTHPHIPGPVGAYRLEHQVPFVLVAPAQLRKMIVQQSPLQYL